MIPIAENLYPIQRAAVDPTNPAVDEEWTHGKANQVRDKMHELIRVSNDLRKQTPKSGKLYLSALAFYLGETYRLPAVVGTDIPVSVAELASNGDHAIPGYPSKSDSTLLSRIQADFPGVNSLNTTIDTAFLLRALEAINNNEFPEIRELVLDAGAKYRINQTLYIRIQGLRLTGHGGNKNKLGTLLTFTGVNNGIEVDIPGFSSMPQGKEWAHHVRLEAFRIARTDNGNNFTGSAIKVWNPGELSLIDEVQTGGKWEAGIHLASAPTPAAVANCSVFGSRYGVLIEKGSQRNVLLSNLSGDDNEALLKVHQTNVLMLSPKCESGFNSNASHPISRLADVDGFCNLVVIGGYAHTKASGWGKEAIRIMAGHPRPTVAVMGLALEGYNFAFRDDNQDRVWSIRSEANLFESKVIKYFTGTYTDRGTVEVPNPNKKSIGKMAKAVTGWNADIERDVVIFQGDSTPNSYTLRPYTANKPEDENAQELIKTQRAGGRITIMAPAGKVINFPSEYSLQSKTSFPYTMPSSADMSSRVVINYYFDVDSLCISSVETFTATKPSLIINGAFGRGYEGWTWTGSSSEKVYYDTVKQMLILPPAPSGQTAPRLITNKVTAPNTAARTITIRAASLNTGSFIVRVKPFSADVTQGTAYVTETINSRDRIEESTFAFTPQATTFLVEIQAAEDNPVFLESIHCR